MSEPQLVAIISVYNSSRWLHDRVVNLMETNIFKRGGLLIYLVNASSPDQRDHEICESLKGRTHFIIDTIPYCSVYGAWNHAIRNTSTPFICNANSDDLVSPDCYDVLIEVCNKHNAHLSFCDWITVGDEPRKWGDVNGSGNGIGYYNPDNDNISCGHFPLWRRSLHDKVGLFDPWFMALGDADFWIRAWRAGIRDFQPINSPLAAYRWRVGSGSPNLWHRIDDGRRADEWSRIHSRTGERLDF